MLWAETACNGDTATLFSFVPKAIPISEIELLFAVFSTYLTLVTMRPHEVSQ